MRTVRKTWRREQMERRNPQAVGASKKRASPPMNRTEWTTQCYTLLDSLRQQGFSSDLREEMNRLWIAFQRDEAVRPCEARAAGLVCFAGYSIAIAGGDFAAATEFLHAYFRNPLVDSEDKATRLSHRRLLANSLHFCGREAEAVALYRQLLATARRVDSQTVVLGCRDHLIAFCESQPADSAASGETAALAADIVSRLRRKKVAATIVPGQTTHGQLLDALISTRGSSAP